MPPIQVLHGQPTPEELATVLAVVSARAAAAQAAAEAARLAASGPASPWNDHARRMTPTPHPGPTVWRTSGWAT
ncbi:acyl-CoA carboxylase subunit epsilon [Kitasatospora mediocidica]|uniref:acyl-CoA carboxylase subunit epsilon n=1 Tax=Kitasatospora mediocidica TaxID=58352 RepID=UPI00055CA413|nr:acyl-CoA carboxylase subunit epsilon [Kitasatospora mediocidica]